MTTKIGLSLLLCAGLALATEGLVPLHFPTTAFSVEGAEELDDDAVNALVSSRYRELRADFQRYYGLNLDGMGMDYTVTHAADLAVNLPRESCSWTAENPVNGWTRDQQLLALIEYHLATWNWPPRADLWP